MPQFMRQAVIGLLWLVLGMAALAQPFAPNERSPITPGHLQAINERFAREGIRTGFVELDPYGRVILKGEYADEPEVDRAFSLAQVTVGVRWVSPVTPENIRVKTWEQRLGSLFARSAVLQPSGRDGAAPGPIRNRYALVVGVGRFRHGINPLEFAARDAENFYQFLVDPQRGRFDRRNIALLTNENATRANVAAGLDRLRQIAEEDDLVVVYMSSHGSPPDKRGAVNIVTHDTEVSPRERVWHTSINEELLRNFMNGLRAKRLVMILDTCFSNGAYRAVPGFLPPGGKSLGADDNEGYGISREYSRRLIGAKDLVPDTPQNSTRGAAKSGGAQGTDPWGWVLIGASDASEQSWESDRLRNSIFTFYFVDGLNRFNGSVQQAFDYAKPRVLAHVRQEKGPDISQHPQAQANVPNWNMPLAGSGR